MIVSTPHPSPDPGGLSGEWTMSDFAWLLKVAGLAWVGCSICVGRTVDNAPRPKGLEGGVDILVVILNKYLRLSYSVMSFVIDGLIIAVGLFVLKDVVLSLIGILSAFVFAITLEFVFVGKKHAMTASIISREKSAEINDFIQNEIGQGTQSANAKKIV